ATTRASSMAVAGLHSVHVKDASAWKGNVVGHPHSRDWLGANSDRKSNPDGRLIPLGMFTLQREQPPFTERTREQLVPDGIGVRMEDVLGTGRLDEPVSPFQFTFQLAR